MAYALASSLVLPCPIADLVRVFGLKLSTMTSMLAVGIAGSAKTDVQKLVDKIEREIGDRVSPADLEGFQATMKAIEDATDVVLRQR